MDLEFAKLLIDSVIFEWYLNGKVDQVDISLLEIAVDELEI